MEIIGPLFIVVMALVILVFNVNMLLDVLKNPKLDTTQQLLWGIGIFLISPLVGVVYLFVAYSKQK